MILADENIDHSLIAALRAAGYMVNSVYESHRVSGKRRYKRNVATFSGTFRVGHLADLDRRYLDVATEDSLSQGYTAMADFSLQENAGSSNTGKFIGSGTLDFYITPRGRVGYAQVMGCEDAPARGQGLLFNGSWIDSKTGQQKDLLLARSVFMYRTGCTGKL